MVVGPRAYNKAQEAYAHCVGQVYIGHLQQYDYFILYKTTRSIGGNISKSEQYQTRAAYILELSLVDNKHIIMLSNVAGIQNVKVISRFNYP